MTEACGDQQGTTAGYQRHRAAHRGACEPCRTAWLNTSHERPRRRSGPQPRPITHGTDSGYAAHIRRNTPPCDDCKAAHTAKQIARRRLTRPARHAGAYTAIPTRILADLYVNADIAAQERAEAAINADVLTKAVELYDQEAA